MNLRRVINKLCRKNNKIMGAVKHGKQQPEEWHRIYGVIQRLLIIRNADLQKKR